MLIRERKINMVGPAGWPKNINAHKDQEGVDALFGQGWKM